MPRACLLLPHLAPSGGVRHVLRFADGLASRGWEVRVRVINRAARGDSNPFPFLSGFEVEHGSLHTLVPKADEVVVSFGDAPNELFLGSRLRRTPSVLLVLDWLYFRPDAQRRYLLQGNWSAIAVSSPWLAENVRDLLGGYEPFVVGGGVSPDFYFDPPPGPAPSVLLGSLYSSIPAKGWDDAVKALLLVREARPDLDVRLVAFGAQTSPESPGGNLLVRYVEKPSTEDLRRLYSSVDVWICTSASEGYGFVSLEALACGAALVTYRNGGEAAFARDGENALVVEPTPRAAADAVLRILDDTGLAASLRTEAEDVRRTHAWPVAVDAFENCLFEVLR